MIVRHNRDGAYFVVKTKVNKSTEKIEKQLNTYVEFLISRNPVLNFNNGIEVSVTYLGDDFAKNKISYIITFKDNLELIKNK